MMAPPASHQRAGQPLKKQSSAGRPNEAISEVPVAVASRSSSFRPASDLLPPQVDPPTDSGAPPSEDLSLDAVSKSIVSRAPHGGVKGRPTEQHRGGQGNQTQGGGGGSERQWSEEWLRIAEPEQLDRIVPALEATIHKNAGDRDVIRRNDIAGLDFVKSQIEEVLILPRQHPELFASALTRPARGLLLFGPPGTGKTLLARWVAAECGATFFNINASSVLSKWIGEAEKTVKALFQLATERQPSVIFIDEIDSLLSTRRDADAESSRRVKNEFLTSLEGADTAQDDKVLLIGATNMPWELDPAALRRLSKRLYVPLPGQKARLALLRKQLAQHNAAVGLQGALAQKDLQVIVSRTEGFSGSDLQSLLREAAMGPVREAMGSGSKRRCLSAPGPRDILVRDFDGALRRIRPSFSQEEATRHADWNQEYGTCHGEDAMHDNDGDGSATQSVDSDGEGRGNPDCFILDEASTANRPGPVPKLPA